MPKTLVTGEKMDAEELTRQIIQGYKNLESMRKEIFAVVPTLLEIVLKKRQGRSRNTGKVIRFKSKHCRWEIFPTAEDGRVSLKCLVKCGSNVWSEALVYSGEVFGVRMPSLSQIETVYDDLPTFVEGMIKLFPFLEKAIEPLLKAAKKQM